MTYYQGKAKNHIARHLHHRGLGLRLMFAECYFCALGMSALIYLAVR